MEKGSQDKISTEEIKSVFNKFDADQSGQLELEECLECISALGIDISDKKELT